MKNYFLDRFDEKESLRKVAKKDSKAAKRWAELTGEEVELEIEIPDFLLPPINITATTNIPSPPAPSTIQINLAPGASISWPSIVVPNSWPPSPSPAVVIPDFCLPPYPSITDPIT